MESHENHEDDGRLPDVLPELLFLFTLFGIVAWVGAAFLFVL